MIFIIRVITMTAQDLVVRIWITAQSEATEQQLILQAVSRHRWLFQPTFFLANKFPVTFKGTFRETKLKYVLSAFIGTQTIQGQIGLLGPTPGVLQNQNDAIFWLFCWPNV